MPDDEQPKNDPPEPEAEPEKDAPEADGPKEEAAADVGADRFRPEAIAARVQGLGEESEADRVARLEEGRLQERRKGKKGSRGLATAASKRLAKIGEAKVRRPSSARAGFVPEADPLLERTARLSKWVREHQQTFAALVAIAVLGAGGGLGWYYWQGKREADASALLAQGIADEHGRIADKDDDDDQPASLYPTFKTTAERGDAALAKYKDVEAKFPGTGAAILARLSEAGLLLDRGDAKGAAAAYSDVKSSPLALADTEVRARALEGEGFADELQAQTDAANRDKHLDDALAVFKQLEQIDAKGFKELGKYHEARVLQVKGDRAKAIELLKDVHTAVTAHDAASGDPHPFPYLEVVSEDRLRDLDPTALPPKMSGGAFGKGGGLGGPGGPDMSDPRVQEMLRQLQEQMQNEGKTPPVPAPPP